MEVKSSLNLGQLSNKCGSVVRMGPRKGQICGRVSKRGLNPICSNHMKAVKRRQEKEAKLLLGAGEGKPTMVENPTEKAVLLQKPEPKKEGVLSRPLVPIPSQADKPQAPEGAQVINLPSTSSDESDESSLQPETTLADIDSESDYEEELSPKKKKKRAKRRIDETLISANVSKLYRDNPDLHDQLPLEEMQELSPDEKAKLINQNFAREFIVDGIGQTFGMGVAVTEAACNSYGVNMTGLHDRLAPEKNPPIKRALDLMSVKWTEDPEVLEKLTPFKQLMILMLVGAGDVYAKNHNMPTVSERITDAVSAGKKMKANIEKKAPEAPSPERDIPKSLNDRFGGAFDFKDAGKVEEKNESIVEEDDGAGVGPFQYEEFKGLNLKGPSFNE